jgi:effector-binding domain-containing protein
MDYDIELRELDAQPTISIHRELPVSEIPGAMQHAIPRTWGYAASHGGGPKTAFARYMSITPQRVVFDVGVTLERSIPGDGEIVAADLPSGDAAYTLHIGPFDAMQAAYQALDSWIRANGRVPGEGPWEVYLTDPQSEPDPARWRTEIYWPIA